MKRIVVILLILSIFLFIPVSANDTDVSFAGFIYFEDHLIDLFNNSNSWFPVDNLQQLSLYVPYRSLNLDTGDNAIYSGSCELVFEQGIDNFNFTNFRPKTYRVNLSDDLSSSAGTVNLDGYYSNGSLVLDSSAYAIDATLSLKFLPDVTYPRVILNYVFLIPESKYRDFTIDFIVPNYSGKIMVESFNQRVTIFNAPSTAVQDALRDLTSINTDGFNGVESSVNSLYQLSQDSYFEERELLSDLKDEIINVNSHMSDNVVNALDDWQQEHIDYVENNLSTTIEDLTDEITGYYDYDGMENLVHQIYNVITGGTSRGGGTTVLPIPAGTVTINGREFTFWEATEIDFGPYFDMPFIQPLLIAFRFIFGYGVFSYCVFWVRKILDLITLRVHVSHNNNSGE